MACRPRPPSGGGSNHIPHTHNNNHDNNDNNDNNNTDNDNNNNNSIAGTFRYVSHPAREISIMLSARQLPQPNPSYPARCRQDTTYAWGTDFGGHRLRGAWHIWHGGAVNVDGLVVGLLFTSTMASKSSTSELVLAMNTSSVLLWAPVGHVCV